MAFPGHQAMPTQPQRVSRRLQARTPTSAAKMGHKGPEHGNPSLR